MRHFFSCEDKYTIERAKSQDFFAKCVTFAERFYTLASRADSKEREKTREKKLAHGQKEGLDAEPDYDNGVYDSQATESILTMFDYLISLGDQSGEQESEAPAVPSASDYDFDNAYAEYESEYIDDDDYYDDEDYDDVENQDWGMSM